MKASLRSVRISPKKANLVAKMIRGLPVQDALHSLEQTNKKAARIFEKLLKSAIANAQNNDNQDPGMLAIKTLIVNQAQAYHRSIPMARGRARPIRKFLSHITLTLGVESQPSTVNNQPLTINQSKKTKKEPSQKLKKKVQTSRSRKSASDTEKGSSSSKKKTTPDPRVSAEQDSPPSEK